MDTGLSQLSGRTILGGLVPHTCDYCERLAITCSGQGVDMEFTFPLEQVLSAASNGCKLFKERVRRLNDLISCLPPRLEYPSLSLRVTINWETSDFRYIDFEWLVDAKVLSDQVLDACWSDKLHAFALDEDLAARHITARPLNSELSSDHIIGLMRHWLQDCRKHHVKCREITESVYAQGTPSRLLDVGLQGTPNIRLYMNCSQELLPYAALSYCWGGDQETKTTMGNQQQRFDGIPLTTLPKTIQDAVDTSRRLGFRYLWVDALCIIQDDRNDWEREVGKMSRIYEGASITISAARAACSDSGFLQERNLAQAYVAVYRIRYRIVCEGFEEVGCIMLCEESIHNSLEERLDSRGWALQERLMSPRVLRFGSKQLEWICQRARHVDGGYAYTESSRHPKYFDGTMKDKRCLWPRQGKFNERERGILHNDWTDLVAQYSKRHLSKLSDRLPAFSAIAESFAEIMRWDSSNYWAGLWKLDVSAQLLWRRPTTQPPDGGMQISKRSGPSWSWASVPGEVYFGHQRLIWGGDGLKDIGCNITLKSVHVKYGEVESGHLTVRGYIRQVYWTGYSFVNVTLDSSGQINAEPNEFLPITIFWDMYNALPPQNMWCLEVDPQGSRKSCGLILTVVQDPIYTRVAYFEFDCLKPRNEEVKQTKQAGSNTCCRHSRNFNWFRNEERRTIHII